MCISSKSSGEPKLLYFQEKNKEKILYQNRWKCSYENRIVAVVAIGVYGNGKTLDWQKRSVKFEAMRFFKVLFAKYFVLILKVTLWVNIFESDETSSWLKFQLKFN